MQPLIVPAVGGDPLSQYPGQIVAPLRQMVTRITREDLLPQRLGMVAALRQEGVSFLAQALAAMIAHDFGVRVCLVELNWWWPSSLMSFAEDNGGLAAILTDGQALEDSIISTGWSNLAFVPAGHLPAEIRPVMARSQVLRETILELSGYFDHLILDIPAVGATSDAVPLASLTDACCLVIRHGVTVIEDVRLAMDEIDHLRLLGVVMNRADLKTPRSLVKLVQKI